MKMLSISEAATVIGVCAGTLRRWEREGKLRASTRTIGGHRRYSLTDINHLLVSAEKEKGRTVAYARVSSKDQKLDLTRQIAVLEAELKAYTGTTEVISDLGSGINFKKKGLQRLILLLITNQIDTLLLTHKDRLLRFGSELIFQLCEHFGTKVVLLDTQEKSKSDEETFAEDVIELITVFSSRLCGKRSHKNAKRVA